MRFADSACNLPEFSSDFVCQLFLWSLFILPGAKKHFYPSFCRALYSTIRMRVSRPAKVDYNKFTMGNPIPESTLTLCQSRLYSTVRDLGFGLRFLESYLKTTGIGFSSTTNISFLKKTNLLESWNVRSKNKVTFLGEFFYNSTESHKISTFLRGYAQSFLLAQKSNQNTWFSATLDFSLVFRWFSAVSPTLCTVVSKKTKLSCFGGFFSLVF